VHQFGKVIRIDTKSVRSAGRSTQGVKLLDLEDQDKAAAAVVQTILLTFNLPPS
jgi:DNA gyrase subunit A